MYRYCFLILWILGSGWLSGCTIQQEPVDKGRTVLTFPPSDLNETDKWLYDHFTAPYNVTIKYRWDQSELPNAKNLTPPRVEKVIPMADLLRKCWFEPYEAVSSITVLRKYAPKTIVFVGSPHLNEDGTQTLGVAEGGNKVVLYEVNEYAPTEGYIRVVMKIMHHEFGHILHQNILYPVELRNVTPSGYTGEWFNFSLDQALSLGFVSQYARKNVDEDFCEMLSHLLALPTDEYNALLNQTTTYGRARLQAKTAIIAAYFDTSWNMNFDLLRATTHAAVDGYIYQNR